MTNPKLGNKHSCKGCDTRFFDMKKSPAVCPKCGLEAKEPKASKAKRSGTEPAPSVSPAPGKAPKAAPETSNPDGEGELDEIDEELAELIPADEDDPDDVSLDDDDDDDDLIEDASDLGEDDDDLLGVREGIDVESLDKT